MKVGDLVKSSRTLALVLKASTGDPCIFVKILKTGGTGWVNKHAFEVISASR